MELNQKKIRPTNFIFPQKLQIMEVEMDERRWMKPISEKIVDDKILQILNTIDAKSVYEKITKEEGELLKNHSSSDDQKHTWDILKNDDLINEMNRHLDYIRINSQSYFVFEKNINTMIEPLKAIRIDIKLT